MVRSVGPFAHHEQDRRRRLFEQALVQERQLGAARDVVLEGRLAKGASSPPRPGAQLMGEQREAVDFSYVDTADPHTATEPTAEIFGGEVTVRAVLPPTSEDRDEIAHEKGKEVVLTDAYARPASGSPSRRSVRATCTRCWSGSSGRLRAPAHGGPRWSADAARQTRKCSAARTRSDPAQRSASYRRILSEASLSLRWCGSYPSSASVPGTSSPAWICG